MKKLVVALSIVALSAAWGLSQEYRIRTDPKLPPRDVLARMNLVMAWNTRLAIEGNRDGVFSVQVIPGTPKPQVIAQTYLGRVYLFDADSGDLLWKTQIGVPYAGAQPVGYNSQSIFVTRGNVLHVLNRFKGVQRVYTFDPMTKESVYGFALSYTPSAAPVADEELLHFSMGDWVQTYIVPDFERIDQLKAAAAAGDKLAAKKLTEILGDEAFSRNSPHPAHYWSYRIAPETTAFPVLFHGDRLSILFGSGSFVSVNRYERGPRQELFDFKMNGLVRGAAGQYHAFAYVGSDDANLYAFNMDGGRLLWRHLSGAAILQAPAVNDRDIYIAPERLGLRLLDRASGRAIWTNRDASRFLAANDKFVYALDKFGRFFVLDGARGSTLAKYDFADWAIPVANEWTDRIYLAANDGQLICLRSRDLPRSLVMKSPEVIKKAEPKKPKKDEMKENKKDAEKDAEKMGRLGMPHPPLTIVAQPNPAWQARLAPDADMRRRWAGR